MIIEMNKLERRHYLKHYVGGFAMALDENNSKTGQIEGIDMEDGSVCIKSGDESHWYDGDSVTPSLKFYKDLSMEDLKTIVNNISIQGNKMFASEMKSIMPTPFFTNITMKSGLIIMLEHNWNIVVWIGPNIQSSVDNIGTIIFLLCELGYDVTGHFK